MKMEHALDTTKIRKRVLVFDTSKGYSRMINRFFGRLFDIQQCANAKALQSLDLEAFDCAMVIINHNDDVLVLKQIKAEVKTVFLGCREKDFDPTLYKLEGVEYLNLFDRKTIFLKYLILKLKELNLLDNSMLFKQVDNNSIKE